MSDCTALSVTDQMDGRTLHDATTLSKASALSGAGGAPQHYHKVR
jgi:hypothetical protein